MMDHERFAFVFVNPYNPFFYRTEIDIGTNPHLLQVALMIDDILTEDPLIIDIVLITVVIVMIDPDLQAREDIVVIIIKTDVIRTLESRK